MPGLSPVKDVVNMKLAIAAVLIFLMNLNCFLLMRRDKQLARKGQRRIPERTLFLSAALFGGLGGVLGMQLLRHKTKHWYFRVFFPLMAVVQAGIAGYAAWRWLL